MERRTLLADSGYWIAFLYPGDQHHARATAVATGLGQVLIVTTQMALTEVFNAMARTGERGRRHVVQLLDDLETDPDIEIIPQTNKLFRAAVEKVPFSK